jgi:hypothetical protein
MYRAYLTMGCTSKDHGQRFREWASPFGFAYGSMKAKDKSITDRLRVYHDNHASSRRKLVEAKRTKSRIHR